jgi:hypothetical protein
MMKTLFLMATSFLLSGCGIFADPTMWVETKGYSGDGVIHTCSTLFGGGYGIDFPKFDASRPYTASYRISNVPQTARERSGFSLRFLQPDYRMAKSREGSVTATFSFTLCDQRNTTLHSAQVSVSRAGWSQSQGLFSVYAGKKSYVHFERGARYVLKVSYTPGTRPPPAKELFFAIDNCSTY